MAIREHKDGGCAFGAEGIRFDVCEFFANRHRLRMIDDIATDGKES